MELGGTRYDYSYDGVGGKSVAETDDDNFEKQFIQYAMIIIVKIYVFFLPLCAREHACTHTCTHCVSNYKCYGGTFYVSSRRDFCKHTVYTCFAGEKEGTVASMTPFNINERHNCLLAILPYRLSLSLSLSFFCHSAILSSFLFHSFYFIYSHSICFPFLAVVRLSLPVSSKITTTVATLCMCASTHNARMYIKSLGKRSF